MNSIEFLDIPDMEPSQATTESDANTAVVCHDDFSTDVWSRIAMTSGAYDFWKDPAEDVY